jgi:hypothetical protein
MEAYEHRIVNGLLKAGVTARTPEAVHDLLDTDVEIVVPEERGGVTDLWPCVWALAAVCSRQFQGSVMVRAGISEALPSPARLSSRCVFDGAARRDEGRPLLTIGVGAPSGRGDLWGDARGDNFAFGEACPSSGTAHPIGAFALAGYLGFAALAVRAGIPPFREDLAVKCLTIGVENGVGFPSDGLAMCGLGQLGQAYLAQLYFLQPRHLPGPVRLVLLDKDPFGPENGATQILLDDDSQIGFSKALSLAEKARGYGWDVAARADEFTWDTKRRIGDPGLTMLGFDNMDARRMALSAGYDWIVDAGLRDSFTEPLVTWHSLPGGRGFLDLFPRSSMRREEPGSLSGDFFERLRKTPGGCGWLTFAGVTASAPSLGLVAAAFAWSEVLVRLAGGQLPRRGIARLWSPLLPYERTVLAVPRS